MGEESSDEREFVVLVYVERASGARVLKLVQRVLEATRCKYDGAVRVNEVARLDCAGRESTAFNEDVLSFCVCVSNGALVGDVKKGVVEGIMDAERVRSDRRMGAAFGIHEIKSFDVSLASRQLLRCSIESMPKVFFMCCRLEAIKELGAEGDAWDDPRACVDRLVLGIGRKEFGAMANGKGLSATACVESMSLEACGRGMLLLFRIEFEARGLPGIAVLEENRKCYKMLDYSPCLKTAMDSIEVDAYEFLSNEYFRCTNVEFIKWDA